MIDGKKVRGVRLNWARKVWLHSFVGIIMVSNVKLPKGLTNLWMWACPRPIRPMSSGKAVLLTVPKLSIAVFIRLSADILMLDAIADFLEDCLGWGTNLGA